MHLASQRISSFLRALLYCAGVLVAFSFGASAVTAAPSELSVTLRLDSSDFVVGERVRVIVDIQNSSPEKIVVNGPESPDRLFVEVFRSSDMHALARTSKREFVARFRLNEGEGVRLETFLGDHYALNVPSRYLAKPVLVHRGIRFEGTPRTFDVVDGVRAAGALQLFANKPGLQREFELVYWARGRGEHLFLKAADVGKKALRYETRDLGQILRIDKPTVSIKPTGEVIVFHRLNADQLVRSEFWSLSDELVFRSREAVRDPETAGTQRVRELYKNGGVKAKKNPWWKFW